MDAGARAHRGDDARSAERWRRPMVRELREGRVRMPDEPQRLAIIDARFATPGSRFTGTGKATRARSGGKSGTPNCASTRRRTAARKPASKSGGGSPMSRFPRQALARLRVQNSISWLPWSLRCPGRAGRSAAALTTLADESRPCLYDLSGVYARGRHEPQSRAWGSYISGATDRLSFAVRPMRLISRTASRALVGAGGLWRQSRLLRISRRSWSS